MNEKLIEKKLKKYIKVSVIVGIAIGVVFSITTSYILADALINSKDVYYQDNSSLGASNVQAAIDGTCTKFSNQLTTLQTTIESNVDKKITTAKTDVLNKAYPVGSIYISTSNTNPESLFGGTWIAWGSGRVPVGVNTSDTDFNTVEKTGGTKEHKHLGDAFYGIYNGQQYVGITNTRGGVTTAVTDFYGALIEVGTTGSALNYAISYYTSSEKNLPPYITCYMWKRTQ